VNRINTFMS